MADQFYRMDFTGRKPLKKSFRGILSIPKMTTSLILGVLLVFTSVSNGSPNMGHVTGKVTVFQKRLFGKLKKKKDMSGVIVYITGFKNEAPKEVPDIIQKNKRFSPHILPVVAGQKVRFPNYDKIYHNVFSISPIKSFDLGQYKSTEPPKLVTFGKPGLVPVYCNIHPKMLTYVVVLENTAYALTDKDSTFRIKNLPPGTYTLNAWLPQAKRVSQEIQIQSGQEIEVHLELKEILKMKLHKRKDGSDYPPKGKRGKY
jgi:plastocyanin